MALVMETARLLNKLMSGSDGSSADRTATALLRVKVNIQNLGTILNLIYLSFDVTYLNDNFSDSDCASTGVGRGWPVPTSVMNPRRISMTPSWSKKSTIYIEVLKHTYIESQKNVGLLFIVHRQIQIYYLLLTLTVIFGSSNRNIFIKSCLFRESFQTGSSSSNVCVFNYKYNIRYTNVFMSVERFLYIHSNRDSIVLYRLNVLNQRIFFVCH